MNVSLALFILMVLGSSQGARILGIFPSCSISHQLPFQAVMKELASRGHQVTVISPNPLKTPHANYTDVDLSFSYEFMLARIVVNEIGHLNPYQMIGLFSVMSSGVSDMMLGSEVMQDFIKSEPKFDLVFFESLFYQSMYGLVHLVGSPPMIGIMSMGAGIQNFESMGNPSNPAYMPEALWPYSDHMTFLERANSMIYRLYYQYMIATSIMPEQERLMRKYFGSSPPDVRDTERNFSMILVSNHWTVSSPRPLLPGIVELGSLHIQKQNNKLEPDLQEFLDKADQGFIYFSLGSNVRSDKIPEEKRRQFLEAFSQLPQRVLWKWESDVLPGQPKNVRLGKWLPQQDILAHPNIKAFVTQGGLQSTQEAIHFGVPLVGVAFFADQHLNVRRVVDQGVGIKVDFETITQQVLHSALTEIVNNSTYRDNMKKLSALSKDQIQTPLEQAVWWTEYVLRHNGATHLRSAALDLAWWEYLLLDVIAVIVFTLLLVTWIVYWVARRLYRLIVGSGKTQKKKQQ